MLANAGRVLVLATLCFLLLAAPVAADEEVIESVESGAIAALPDPDPQLEYQTYAGAGFHPRSSSTDYLRSLWSGIVGTSGERLIRTVMLPQGSRIADLAFVVRNSANGSFPTVQLLRYEPGAGTFVELAEQLAPLDNEFQFQILEPVLPMAPATQADLIVDNSRYSYQLHFFATESDTSQAIAGARIGFEPPATPEVPEYQFLAGTELTPYSGASWVNDVATSGAIYSTGGTGLFGAEVDLPHGVTIEAITFYVQKTDGADDVIRLRRYEPGSFTPEDVAAGGAASAPIGSIRSYTLIPATQDLAEVDRNRFAYAVEWDPGQAASTTKLVGVRVEYSDLPPAIFSGERVLTHSALAFLPESRDMGRTTLTGGRARPASTGGDFWARIGIPDGAVITRIDYLFQDAEDPENINFTSGAVDPAASSNVFFGTETSGSSSSVRTVTRVVSAAPANNAERSQVVRADIPLPNSGLILVGVQVYYRMQWSHMPATYRGGLVNE